MGCYCFLTPFQVQYERCTSQERTLKFIEGRKCFNSKQSSATAFNCNLCRLVSEFGEKDLILSVISLHFCSWINIAKAAMTWIRDEIRDPSHFLSNLYLPLLLSVWYTSKTYHGWSKHLHNMAREESAGNVLRVLQIEGAHLCTLILYYPIWGSHSVVCKCWNEPGKWRSVPPLLYSDDVFVGSSNLSS